MSKVMCENCGKRVAINYSKISDRFLCWECMAEELYDTYGDDYKVLPIDGIEESEKKDYD